MVSLSLLLSLFLPETPHSEFRAPHFKSVHYFTRAQTVPTEQKYRIWKISEILCVRRSEHSRFRQSRGRVSPRAARREPAGPFDVPPARRRVRPDADDFEDAGPDARRPRAPLTGY